jgi:hypothetical protein
MYRKTPTEGWVYKIDENLFIPPDENNIDHQNYLAWLEAGNKPKPWVPLDAPA